MKMDKSKSMVVVGWWWCGAASAAWPLTPRSGRGWWRSCPAAATTTQRLMKIYSMQFATKSTDKWAEGERGREGAEQIGAAAGQRLLRLHTQPIACLVSIRMSFALIRIAERLPSGNNFMHSQGECREWGRGEVAGGRAGAVRQCPLMPNVDGNCRPSTLDNSHVALCFMQLTGRVF